MKKITILLLFVQAFFGLNSNAQTPNTLNFQGVARDAAGSVIASKTIKVKATIRHGGTAGTSQFSETRSVATNATGGFSVEIGSEGYTSRTGTISGVTWSAGAKYLQVEIDPNNGTTFTSVSNQILTSVPFVKYAEAAGALSPTGKITPYQIQPTTTSTNGKLVRFDGTKWSAGDVYTSFGSLHLPIASGVNLASPATAFTVTNSGTGSGMAITSKGTSVAVSATTGQALAAVNNSTKPTLDVINTAASSVGLEAVSNTGIALNTTAAASGTALDVDGKVKIYGGGSTPSQYALLTSDANGNASWKKTAGVSFGGGTMSITVADALSQEVVPYFMYTTGSTNNGNDFTVPVSGVYQVSASGYARAYQLDAMFGNTPQLLENSIIVRVKRNGVTVQTYNQFYRSALNPAFQMNSELDTYMYLMAGDKVEARVKLVSVGEPAILETFGFGAGLVSAD